MATTADIPMMVDLGCELHEITRQRTPFHRASVVETLTALIRAHDVGVVLVNDAPGMFIGIAQSPMYNRRVLWGWEVWFRAHAGGRELLAEAESRFRAMGCTLMRFSFSEANRPDSMSRYLRRRGYRCAERAMVKEL